MHDVCQALHPVDVGYFLTRAGPPDFTISDRHGSRPSPQELKPHHIPDLLQKHCFHPALTYTVTESQLYSDSATWTIKTSCPRGNAILTLKLARKFLPAHTTPWRITDLYIYAAPCPDTTPTTPRPPPRPPPAMITRKYTN